MIFFPSNISSHLDRTCRFMRGEKKNKEKKYVKKSVEVYLAFIFSHRTNNAIYYRVHVLYIPARNVLVYTNEGKSFSCCCSNCLYLLVAGVVAQQLLQFVLGIQLILFPISDWYAERLLLTSFLYIKGPKKQFLKNYIF